MEETSRDYLERLRRVDYCMRQLDRHRTDVIEDAVRITACIDGVRVQHGPGDPTARAGLTLAEYDRFLSDRLKDLAGLRMKALCLIDKIRDGRYREVLTCRYVYGLSWDAVAAEMSYELPWVFKLHGMALIEFEKVYKEAGNG